MLGRCGEQSLHGKVTYPNMIQARSESLNTLSIGDDEIVKNDFKQEEVPKCPKYDSCSCLSLSTICWGLVLCLASLAAGFLGGLVFSDKMGREVLLQNNMTDHLIQTMDCPTPDPNYSALCSVCSEAGLIRVEGAANADCNGLYSVSNLTVNTRGNGDKVVFERISGGWGKEARHLYWDKHGWALGSLGVFMGQSNSYYTQMDAMERGPPWTVTWTGGVKLGLSRCGDIQHGPQLSLIQMVASNT